MPTLYAAMKNKDILFIVILFILYILILTLVGLLVIYIYIYHQTIRSIVNRLYSTFNIER